MKEKDYLQRFLFEHVAIRGELTHLDDSWREIMARADYPPPLRQVFGQLLAATVLLSANLKYKGSIVLQIQGSGPVTLLVIECSHDLNIRAVAKWEGEIPAEATLREMIGDGRFVVTLDPEDANQAYQGIVAIESDTIAEVLETYLERSEQIETRLWLAADERQVAGLLLQRLPEKVTEATDTDAWTRINYLAGTVKEEELLSLPPLDVIRRLFHEEDVRIFQVQKVRFQCTCNRERVANMLRLIGEEEVNAILEEQGQIAVGCEFCNEQYAFDQVDARQLFVSDTATEAGKTRH